MPELPEVEVVRRGLEPFMARRVIERVEVFEARSLKRHADGVEGFVRALEGREIREVARRGKFLWAPLSDARRATSSSPSLGEALVMHLGMSGQLRVRDAEVRGAYQASEPHLSEGPASDPEKHLRIRLHMAGGSRIDFLDQRIFGGMHVSPLVNTPDGLAAGTGTNLPLLPESAAHIARDLLDPFLDEESLVRQIRTRRAPIKSVILDQGTVSGVGNIYADEALWEAKLHFARSANGISSRKIRELLVACRGVMQRALEVGGTSFDALYVNVDGRRGYFARSLSAYGKHGMPCPRCGRALVRVQFQNRSSHLCPYCQRRR
ncbi:bifunctional DNA-formamidopyrimidine glycosylase/DNA-(apurinic or apyrimidinic site) lyase [Dermabacter vaginalis]|uniref:Bifunctional DNA-formamidopyrimidine glycosylase/DNA-(Apurinic or apyrimidinic site) lyase n=1 Tax=Dermabacter vaginalis TaxID=1630135 RepID=A0ABX6A565_9MICO|nr:MULTISPECIES: bifunctional DNA-formamidopyrimidine glycosylase/DNA-(apurinic or apyrimidinic site) lyase [Dermabacter]MCT2149799.1 bifunctional DNA-formamidopyrimidine glycosylase/DNA-(apurinic or apyrimidinic site) lyase [Dermabacter vaginalis]QEU11790.1 bifunctional DNA-formamidopyrimidine glycosylase/DNA-(apurinic or apyrimidinic site) lyase [Dermabacter vaginalis]RUP87341.1 bifunctional DNA-formamidopyrimidine glycosylase/DNA-(apurinic or apyrimidinic site) lyase [Dermabacter sp. HSID1755